MVMKSKPEFPFEEYSNLDKQVITPEEVMIIYKRHGTTLTLEQAKKVLEFMFTMANIALNQISEDKNYRSNLISS